MNAVEGGVWQAAYIVAALSIVLSIKWLSTPVTARRGVLAGELGLLFAIVGTLLRLARRPLLLTPRSFLGAIQIAAGQFPAPEPMLLHQPPQRVFRGHHVMCANHARPL